MTKLAGIIGHPLGHSVSPPMHQAAFNALNMEVRYRRWKTPPIMLPYRVEAMRRDRCLGANVAIPHKVVAFEYVDETDPLARSIGAINTIVNSEGQLTGHNTDAHGFVTSLKHEIGNTLSGVNALVMGAGGAARAAVFSLADEGAASIAISNRTAPRAAALASDVGPAANARAVNLGDENFEQAALDADLIVNCTSIGMAGGPSPDASPVPRSLLRQGVVVFDMVYNPALTPLLADASDAGAKAIGGLAMLVHQGAAAFELWTGKPAPMDAMFAGAREGMAALHEDS